MHIDRQAQDNRRLKKQRKGAAIVFISITLLVIIAMAMLVIDLGHMRLVRCELQTAADAAALAAVHALDMDTDSARYVAEDFAALNVAANRPASLDRDQDVVFGTYDEAHGTFIELGTNDEYADAVRVTVHATGVPYYFAPLIGLGNFGLSASATARYKTSGGSNFVGLRKVELKSNTVVDAFNSTIGPYASGTAIAEGGVSSNNEVKLQDAAAVYGNAYLGPSASISGAPSGKTIRLEDPLSYPEVDFSEATAANDNASIPLTQLGRTPFDGKKLLVRNGDTLDLPPGAYLFEELKLEANATLKISDLTRLFVTKKIDAEAGAINNLTSFASNLQIYSTEVDPLDEIKLPANHNLLAVIFCPSAKVTKKGTSHFFGSIIAKELKSEGGGLHADRALFRAERGVGAMALLVE